MPRNMSFSLTTDQVRRREKTVTRRFAWWDLQPGTLLWAVVKAMGLKRGERVERICPIRVVSAAPEPLSRLLEDPEYGAAEARREGFPEMSGEEFAEFLTSSTGRSLDEAPMRIEFVYVDGVTS